MSVGPLQTTAQLVRPGRKVQAHPIHIECLVVQLHPVPVYAYVYRFAVNVYVLPANM